MNRCPRILAIGLALLVSACGGGPPPNVSSLQAAIARHTTVWLGPEGLDEETALQLRQVGVDKVVMRRGSVDLGSGVPVLKLAQEPPQTGLLPVGLELTVERLPADLDPAVADALWRALEGDLGDITLAELILNLGELHPNMGSFISALAEVSGAPVVPVLTPEQLASEEARDIIRAARTCIVPAFGSLELFREGAAGSGDLLAEKLAPIADLGARVRVGVILKPQSIPDLGTWGDDLDLICGQEQTGISTSSRLDRTFTFETAMDWSGRSWKKGDRVALRWMDAARLHAGLMESSRIVMPELAGWDLISLPPSSGGLGLNRETLIGYFSGEGPAPHIEVKARRSGRSVRVQMVNTSPFTSTVSSYGNWLEVGVETGRIVVEARGDFDRVILGSRRSGDWRQANAGGSDAVRFLENYLGSSEALETGTIRLPSSRSTIVVRWSLVLSTGEELTGMTRL